MLYKLKIKNSKN